MGGLDSNIDENYLRQVFTPYGEVGYVKIPVGKRCGFVQFTSRLRKSPGFFTSSTYELIISMT